MIDIKLNDFTGSAYCCSRIYSSKEAFLPITYQFCAANIYGLISDFGCGSWGLATCLGGRGAAMPIKGSILVNDKEVKNSDLKRLSCFVGEDVFDEINSEQEPLCVNECIRKALTISGLPFSVQEIKKLFHLSDERFDRSLNSVSGEIWRISIAIGFALNKEIFCYPWMNTHDLSKFVDLRNINVLREYKKIVIIPASRSALKTQLGKSFDHIINFHSYNEGYFNISPEERKRLRKMKGW